MNDCPKLLIIDFPYSGPWGAEMQQAFTGLAQDIAGEPGLIWKMWTENREAARSGGVYLFRDEASREAYLVKHSARLAGFGIADICVQRFDANPGLSAITHCICQR